MLRKVGAFVILVTASAAQLSAASLPEIMAGPSNPVPQCVTPGRLMALLRLRNDELDPRYSNIATTYMRIGEELGLRWDIAFYQMVVETGALTYTRDVRPQQNNFAGLGATGNGVRGESFPDIETGVRGHLEHIRLYAGHPVANPVAERTRKVHEWHILDRWQHSLHRPVTYTDLATKWAPGSRDYTRSIKAIGDQFRKVLCNAPDPHPELVQEARAGRRGTVQAAEAASPSPSGQELAQRAVAQGKAEGTDRRSSLGAQPSRLSNKPSTIAASPAAAAAPYKVTSAPAARQPAAAEKSGSTRYALAGAATAGKARPKITDTAAPPAANQRCRVWTASYGGQKSIIIRSVADQVVNFTVLDVNDGAERREAEAFINAYAKNGKITGEYPSQALALDRAFELCPEG